MAIVDYQVVHDMSAILSWADCSNTNDQAIDRLATPFK
jgi:hypothetical protein